MEQLPVIYIAKRNQFRKHVDARIASNDLTGLFEDISKHNYQSIALDSSDQKSLKNIYRNVSAFADSMSIYLLIDKVCNLLDKYLYQNQVSSYFRFHFGRCSINIQSKFSLTPTGLPPYVRLPLLSPSLSSVSLLECVCLASVFAFISAVMLARSAGSISFDKSE